MKMAHFFGKECYPSFPSEWDDPGNTVFREFYLRCSPDFSMLYYLVDNHMSDKGNEGVTRYRLMKILKDCEYRACYQMAQRRKYPHTWRLHWRIRLTKQYIHRRLHTRHFRNQVELCRISKSVAQDILKKMSRKTVKVGDIIIYNKHTLLVCQASDNACKGCIGFTKQASCKKLPSCLGSIFFCKLDSFEIRKLNKKKADVS